MGYSPITVINNLISKINIYKQQSELQFKS